MTDAEDETGAEPSATSRRQPAAIAMTTIHHEQTRHTDHFDDAMARPVFSPESFGRGIAPRSHESGADVTALLDSLQLKQYDVPHEIHGA
jgi:hypothetical protein